MKLIRAIRRVIDTVQVAYLRRKVFHRKLEALTDPGFLDRALAGDKK